MKENVKNIWIEALLSGNYQKTKFVLRRMASWLHADSYCCLGVLCDILKEKDDLWLQGSGDNFTFNGRDQFPDAKTLERAGIISHDDLLIISRDDLVIKLSYVNDETETFDEAIKFIETNWKNL